MELRDAYDKNFKKIENVVLVRGEPLPEGMFHLVPEILVRHTDGQYLLMQRDACKPRGLMWEASAGGSALQGETALEAAVRELKEETGVSGEMTEIGILADEKAHCIYAEYLCVTDCAKDSVTLQEGETVAYRWVSREELLSLPRDVLSTHRIQEMKPGLII